MDGPEPVPQVIHCLWLGTAELPETRRRSLEVLRETAGAEIVVITDADVPAFEDPDRPVHPLVQYLTVMHRSDYLRAYVTAVRGGGYSDIKANSASWAPSFERLRSTPALDLVGYRLHHSSHAARFGLPTRPTVMGRPVSSRALVWRPSWWRHAWYRMRSAHLPGAAAFVLRPRSPLAVAYLGALEAKLEQHADSLRRGAALSADGTPTLGYETYRWLPGYPFSWTALGADVLHPVGLRFRDRVDLSLPPPVVTDYR